MPSQHKKGHVILAVRLPGEQRDDATTRAREENTTLAELVRMWVANYIETGNPSRPRKPQRRKTS